MWHYSHPPQQGAVVNCGSGVSEMLALAVNIPAELIQ